MANHPKHQGNRRLEKKLAALQPKTRDDYRKLASHFYSERLDDQPPTPKRVRDALRLAAADWRPDYWRRVRNALMYDQVARGYYDNGEAIETIKNPVSCPQTAKDRELRESVNGKPGRRQKRVKKVSGEDLGKLWAYVNGELEDDEVAAAIVIATRTGARPAEMLGIRCMADNVVFIPGAKKTKAGDRGLDRYIKLSDYDWRGVKMSVDILAKADPGKAGTMHKVQERLRTATKRLWPRRKSHPTLYTWRYEMGSELKASGLSRREVAYLMGHQSEQSVDRYGDRRSGSGRMPMRAAPGADMSGVRAGYREPFTPSLEASSGPRLG